LDTSLPKYLNTPETPVFHKGELLYGLHAAFQGIRESGRVVIVEGYMDALALRRHGFNEAVATLGTALTREHVRKLKGYAREAVVVFDSDAAGKSATLKSLPLFLNEGMTARVIALPEGDDPDTFVNSRGLQGFIEYLEKSVPIFEFYLELKLSGGDESIEEQVGILKEILPVLSEVNSESQRALYVRRLSEKSRIPESIVLSELKKQLPSSPAGDEQETRLKKLLSGKTAKNQDDLYILNLLAHFPDTAGRLIDSGCRLLLSDPVITDIFDSICEIYKRDGESNPDVLAEKLSNDTARERYREAILSPPMYSDDVEQALEAFELKVKRINLSRSYRSTGDDLEKKNIILKQKREQDREMNRISKTDFGKAGMRRPK
jgi:DNA primase